MCVLLQALQQHYHPEVSQAASVINQALSVSEISIAPLLELTAFEVRGEEAWVAGVRGLQRGSIRPSLADLRAEPEEEMPRVSAAAVHPCAGFVGTSG